MELHTEYMGLESVPRNPSSYGQFMEGHFEEDDHNVPARHDGHAKGTIWKSLHAVVALTKMACTI